MNTLDGTPSTHAATHRAPAATIVLPVKRGDRAFLDCLRCLEAQDFNEPFEVVVVLDATDDAAGALRMAFPFVHVIACNDRGPGGARNRGIAVAKGRWIVFTDADCLPHPDWLRRLITAARQHPETPVAGWTEPGDRGLVSQASELFERGIPQPLHPISVPGAWGSNLCVESDLLHVSRARFVEDLFGAEDVALIAQLPPDRRRVLLIPDAVVIHNHRFRFWPATRRMLRLGSGSGVVRTRYPAASGAFLARHRWLIPLLPGARLAMLLRRVAHYNPRRLIDYGKLFPWLVWFACVYAIGFATGIRSGRRAGATSG